jgi:hypothetical protein
MFVYCMKYLKYCEVKIQKLVLYVYDSFLFDVDDNEKELLKQVAKVINDKNLQFKVKTGTNYNNIK